MRILHTESSNGWGGQEIRTLKESLALRRKGHTIYLVVTRGGKLVDEARKEGLQVIELDFRRSHAPVTLWQLCRLIRRLDIDTVVTHSSWDAWLGGLAGRVCGKRVVRVRHLSTEIRGGLNALLLYNVLANYVITTSSSIIPKICKKARLPCHRISCIPTGVEPKAVAEHEKATFRGSLGIEPGQILVGSVCVVRSWKGIDDLIKAATLLRNDTRLRWVVVGGGYVERFRPLVPEGVPLVFTGHLPNPEVALASLDVFALLSTAHEGISQASLQAGWFKVPLVTTTVGGLPEVCLDGITGITVPPHSPRQVAHAVQYLANHPQERSRMGAAAHAHVVSNYLLENTLEKVEAVYLTP